MRAKRQAGSQADRRENEKAHKIALVNILPTCGARAVVRQVQKAHKHGTTCVCVICLFVLRICATKHAAEIVVCREN